MKKILLYSHDTYSLGNHRRTMSICQYLMDTLSNLSILIVSGSRMTQNFRLPKGIDYVKLPCVINTERNGCSSKLLEEETHHLNTLRSDIIRCTAAHFKPDLVLVDRKPYGDQKELIPMLSYIQEHLPDTKVTLMLRDMFDRSETARTILERQGLFEAIKNMAAI